MADKDAARDKIRSAIFSGRKFKSKKITMFGSKVEVRQPSVGQLLKMEQSEDRTKALVNMLINYCYVPGTDDKVFEMSDEAGLLELPVSDWLTNFNGAISELSGVDLEEPEKN
jgi:hypothetical protein